MTTAKKIYSICHGSTMSYSQFTNICYELVRQSVSLKAMHWSSCEVAYAIATFIDGSKLEIRTYYNSAILKLV